MADKFKIDNVEIPYPDEYKISFENQYSEDSGVTLDKVDHSEILRLGVSISLSYSSLRWSEISSLLSLLIGKTRLSFYHPDPRNSATWITRTFKPSLPSLGSQVLIPDENGEWDGVWSSVSFTLYDVGVD